MARLLTRFKIGSAKNRGNRPGALSVNRPAGCPVINKHPKAVLCAAIEDRRFDSLEENRTPQRARRMHHRGDPGHVGRSEGLHQRRAVDGATPNEVNQAQRPRRPPAPRQTRAWWVLKLGSVRRRREAERESRVGEVSKRMQRLRQSGWTG